MTPHRLLLLAALVTCCVATAAEKPKLTAFERSQGWRFLFDGSDISSWRSYRADKVGSNWQVRDGSLAGAAGEALVSEEEFGDFELLFDWKVGAGGQGTVFFHVAEDAGSPGQTGPRMLLAGHGAAMGGNGYGPPDRAITPQVDVWYRAKIVVFGNVVEHWLNGERVLTYTVDTPEWRKQVQASGEAGLRELGKTRVGRIVLAGDAVEFRNIKVRSI